MPVERVTATQVAKVDAASQAARTVLAQEAFRCTPGSFNFPTGEELASFLGAGWLLFTNAQGATTHGVIFAKPDGWVKWLVLATQTPAACQPLLSAVKQAAGACQGYVHNAVIRTVLAQAGCTVSGLHCVYQGA